MYKVKTYAPYGLNEREVYEAFLEEIFIPCMYKAIPQGGLFTFAREFLVFFFNIEFIFVLVLTLISPFLFLFYPSFLRPYQY